MAQKIKYSVVIPVFNSEKSLPELHKRLVNVFDGLKETFEIVLVDDCSKDNSWEVMKILHQKDKRVKIIQLMKNFGQHNALMCGFNHVRGEYIVTLDDDLQHPPEEIPKFISKIKEGYAVIYGQYRKKKHFWFQNFGSWIINQMVSKFTGNNFARTSFRIISRDVIKEITKFKNHKVIVDVFINNVLSDKHIGQVLVEHNNRKYGRTNYSLKDLFLFSLNIIFNYTTLPLRLATIMDLLFSLLSIALGVYYLIQYLITEIAVSGFTSIIISISFFSGVILFVLGIIGEYLGRIFTSINNNPQYVVNKIID